MDTCSIFSSCESASVTSCPQALLSSGVCRRKSNGYPWKQSRCAAHPVSRERADNRLQGSSGHVNSTKLSEQGRAREGRGEWSGREPDSNDEKVIDRVDVERPMDSKAGQDGSDQSRSDTMTAPEHRKKTLAGRRSRFGIPHTEDTKRRIAEEIRKLQANVEHRRRISEALVGRPRICSICGREGHNKRSCPEAEGNSQEAVQGKEGQNHTKKLKKLSYAELTALREKRRNERRDRPKSKYKGLSWSIDRSLWHVQVWVKERSTTKGVGYFDEEIEAAREYDKAVLRLRGAGAELNFPEDVKLSLPEPDYLPTTKPEEQNSAPKPVPFPVGNPAIIQRAVESILTAWEAGVRRQRLEYILPFERENETGGLRREFIALRDLVEQTLLQLRKTPQFGGRISVQWLDQSDFVGAWQSEKLAAVVLCTADCLTQLRNLDGGNLGNRLVMVVNPQWQIGGQVISDFGIGKGRRDAEDFVNSFQDVFFMQRRRIMGDNIRLFKCFDSKWQIHYVWPNGKGEVLVGSQAEAPTYEQLLLLLRRVPGSKSSQSWVDRVLRPDWSPEASSADFVFESGRPVQSTNGLEQVKSGKEIVVGASKKEGQAVVQAAAPTQSFAELQDRIAPVSQSPVKATRQENPVESPKHLAASALQDRAALEELKRDPATKAAEFELKSSGTKVPVVPDQNKNRSPDRFLGNRDLRMDALLSIPKLPRQWYSNAFGKESDDARQQLGQAKKPSANPRKTRPERSKQAKQTGLGSSDEVESWVEDGPNDSDNSIEGNDNSRSV